MEIRINSVKNAYAVNFSANLVVDGINQLSFQIPPSQYTTFYNYMQATILIELWISSQLIGAFYITSVNKTPSVVNVSSQGRLIGEKWRDLKDGDGKFLLETGTIHLASTNTITCYSEDNTNNLAWGDDTYNNQYVIVSESTSNNENKDCANGANDYIGHSQWYDNTNLNLAIQSGSYASVKKTSTASELQLKQSSAQYNIARYHIGLNIAYLEIPKTATIKAITVEMAGSHIAKKGIANPSVSCSFQAYLTKGNTDTRYRVGGSPAINSVYNFFSPVGDVWYPWVIHQTYTNPVGLADIFTQGANYWEGGYLGIASELFQANFNDYYIYWSQLTVSITYRTADFDEINVKITDTLNPNQVQATLESGNFQSVGVSNGDKWTICKSCNTALEQLNIENLQADAFDRGIGVEYFGGDLLNAFQNICSYLDARYFEYTKNNQSIIVVKPEDNLEEEATELTTFKTAKNLQIENNVYGTVAIAYRDGIVYKSNTSGNLKVYPEIRKDIITQGEASKYAQSLADKLALPRQSFELEWDSFLFLQVGNKYTFTIDGTTYSNLICRRVDYTQDGALGKCSVKAEFGGGFTPSEEKVGKAIGDLKKRMNQVDSLHFSSSFIPTNRHNSLSGIYGSAEGYHISSAQSAILDDTESKRHGVNDANSSSLPIGGGTLTGDLTLGTDKKVYFRDTDMSMYSNASGYGYISVKNGLSLWTPTIYIPKSFSLLAQNTAESGWIGLLQWSSDSLQLNQDILLYGDKKVNFRDANNYIYSSGAGELKEVSTIQHWISCSGGSVVIDSGGTGYLRYGTSDRIRWGATAISFTQPLFLPNNTPIYYANALGTANLNILNIGAGNELQLGYGASYVNCDKAFYTQSYIAVGTHINLKNNKAIYFRNAADSADLECLKLNNYDQFVLVQGAYLPDLAPLVLGSSGTHQLRAYDLNTFQLIYQSIFQIINGSSPVCYWWYGVMQSFYPFIPSEGIYLPNNKAIFARNAANSADLECLKLNTSDQLRIGAGVSEIYLDKTTGLVGDLVFMLNNKPFQCVNAAGTLLVDIFRLDGSNILQLGSGAVSVNLPKPTQATQLKALDAGNYKGTQCLNWGTSGTPTNISFVHNDQTSTVVDIDNHLAAIRSEHIGAWNGFYKSFTATTIQYISFFVRLDDAAQLMSIHLCNAAVDLPLSITFASDGNMYLGEDGGGSVFAQWIPELFYHIVIDFHMGGDCPVYINGAKIATMVSTKSSTIDKILFQTYDATTAYSFWIDALYVGTDKTAAFLSLTDTQIYTKQQTLTDERIEAILARLTAHGI